MPKNETSFNSFHKTSVVGLITHVFTSKKGNEVYFLRKLFVLEDGSVGGEHFTITLINGKKTLAVGQVVKVKGALVLSIDAFKNNTFIKKSVIVDLSNKYGNSILPVIPTEDMKMMITTFNANQ